MGLKTDKIKLHREGMIGWLIFNNPSRHNAMSLEMWQGLGDGLFSVTSLLLTVLGVLLLHLSSNVFNDYFDVSDGTDEGNNEYFQPAGAAITGGSRAISAPSCRTVSSGQNSPSIAALSPVFIQFSILN